MTIKRDNPDAEITLSSSLLEGGIAIAPCDTIYGILGKAPDSAEKIRDLKGRADNKPFLVLEESAQRIVDQSKSEIPDALLSLWPGPITVVVATKTGTTGFRVPDDTFLRRVLRRTGPLYSTSVNKSGSPVLNTIQDIISEFEARVSLVVDAGDFEGHLPSTVVDISTVPYTLVRLGAIDLPESIMAKTR